MNKASQTREFQSLEMREKFGQVFSSQKPEKDQAMNIEKNRKLIKEVLLYYMHYNNDVTFLGGDR